MRTSQIKSYYTIEAEEGNDAAQALCRQDGDWIDENFPQLTRSFQVVHQRLDYVEALMGSLKEALLQINSTLQMISIYTGEQRNETKH